MSASLLILILANAFTGWLVLWLTIRVLLNRVVPRNLPLIARKAGDAAQDLFDPDALAARLTDPAGLTGVMPSIEVHIDEFLHTRLKEKIPVISVFIGESTLKKLKEGLMEEIETLLPQVITQYAGNMTQHIDVRALVQGPILQLNAKEAALWIRNAFGREIVQLQLAGAGIGLLVGLASAGIALAF